MAKFVRIKRIVTIETTIDRSSYVKMTDNDIRKHEMDISNNQFWERLALEWEMADRIDPSTMVTFEDE